MSPEIGGVVLHSQLLPSLDRPPGLHPDLTVGLHPEDGVTDTAVVQQREGGEYGSAGDPWEKVMSVRQLFWSGHGQCCYLDIRHWAAGVKATK